MNRLELTGEVVAVEPLRHTPAGIPLLSFMLRHLSEQVEAGMPRRVECEVNAVAMGKLAENSHNIKQGTCLKVTGFIARRSLKSSQLVLHLNTLEYL